ncbi:SH3 domain-containing protein [Dyella humicola]|uniref:C40 family peptidase n=1 Tax=Dyella humicola TaxID=2992126 RepID=UPI00225AAC12|nr:SH3 domain-containing protein [Dyella humicola]
MRLLHAATWLLAASLVVSPARAYNGGGQLPVPPSGVIGIDSETMLTPDFWIHQLAEPDRVLLGADAIASQNAQLFQVDPSMRDLRTLPAALMRDQVVAWIKNISELPKQPLYDEKGERVPADLLQQVSDGLALDGVPMEQHTRYGLVLHRAALRSFPTDLRVFTSADDSDIDRFQETAEFPGTPVVIAHESSDGQWLFVLSPRYAAWTRKDNIAEGSAEQVFGYAGRRPRRVVTGPQVVTVYSPEQPGVSQLQLDMGVAVPVMADHPADQPVNGESPYTSHVIELPIRTASGMLGFSPALIQRHADTAADYLPLTEANILHQAFKFLGERYGWGHAYDGRDCSGFVADVYRSMGVQMPRDTSRQAVSPALTHQVFTSKDRHDVRMKAVNALQVGDLVYIPGHVMMVIGRRGGEPYVIHDTTGISYRDDGGALREVKLNAVSVTPLLPLMLDSKHSYVDSMTSIVRVRP